jgi:hypothetical protein
VAEGYDALGDSACPGLTRWATPADWRVVYDPVAVSDRIIEVFDPETEEWGRAA